MIYPHHQKAIEFITEKFQADSQIDALLIAGSIMHGFNSENSDVDIILIISPELCSQKEVTTYYETAESFYPGGYFDGKFHTLDYLATVAERGNEPTRFALHDAHIAFDKTGKAADFLKRIGTYDTDQLQDKTIRFLSQMDAWKWYAGEGLKRNNQYLLELSVSKLILFAGRLILLENRLFFPYHKWFLKVLENAEKKPPELMSAIEELMKDKSAKNIKQLYDMVREYKDWTEGKRYSWTSNFVFDVETLWERQDEFVENI